METTGTFVRTERDMAEVLHGWALAMQGQGEAGLAEMRRGLAADLATGSKSWQPYVLGLLAEAYGAGGHPDEGLHALAEALAVLDTTELRYYAAELSRLKGALLLQQAIPDAAQAEACFQQALDVAVSSRPNPGNSAPPLVWRACGSPRASARRPTTCWPRSTTGSPKGLIRRISKRRRHCWTNFNPKDITCEVCIGQLRRHPAALNRPRKTEEDAA
jgi:hypothetical protein